MTQNFHNLVTYNTFSPPDQRISQLQHQNQLFQSQLQNTSQMHSELKEKLRESDKKLQQAKQEAVSNPGSDAQLKVVQADNDSLKQQLDAVRGQAETERTENQAQQKALEINVQQLQNRLDRQVQKMRDLEMNYAEV